MRHRKCFCLLPHNGEMFNMLCALQRGRTVLLEVLSLRWWLLLLLFCSSSTCVPVAGAGWELFQYFRVSGG